MDHSRVVWGTVAVIALLTAATGPLGVYEVPDSRATASLGEGNATVTVVSAPETIPLEPGRYGNDEYHLRVPDAVVRVENLTGNPILNYNLDIDGLGTSKTAAHFLGEAGEGRRHLGFADSAMAGDEIEQERYDAQLEIVLRANGTERVVFTRSATVEVRG